MSCILLTIHEDFLYMVNRSSLTGTKLVVVQAPRPDTFRLHKGDMALYLIRYDRFISVAAGYRMTVGFTVTHVISDYRH